MNGIGPLLEDFVSVEFDCDDTFAFPIIETHNASMFSLGFQPRERIDSEEFEEGSFRKNSKGFQDSNCQTFPFDIHKIGNNRAKNRRRRVSASLPKLPKQLQFPLINRRKKLAKVTVRRIRAIGRSKRRMAVKPTGRSAWLTSARQVNGSKWPLKVTKVSRVSRVARASKVVDREGREVTKPRQTVTLDNLGSMSGEAKSTRDTCTSLTPKTKMSVDQRGPGYRGLEKLQSKINKLKTYWTLRNRIQPQIFRFLVYDFDTRKLSFEFVDHSLKGILMDQAEEEEKEVVVMGGKGERRSGDHWEALGSQRKYFPFED